LKDASRQQKEILLSCISFQLLDGLFVIAKEQMPIEEQLLQVIRAMEEQSTDCLRDLQEWQGRSEPFQRTFESSVQKLPNRISDEDDSAQQREYILNMLESAREQKPAPTAIFSTDNNATISRTSQTPAPKAVSAADELERRIHQVKQILPEFGEGFIETALSLYQGNVETTVSILLNDSSQYPTTLSVLDRSLPRRRKERSREEAEESTKARQIVKERVALEATQEEERYKALLYISKQNREAAEQEVGTKNEYDDDYDDQYDEIDVKLGGADDGFYDFEQVKLYNQVVRADEAEDSFWEENRNANKLGSNSPAGNGEKQYRGPDKIKGGRVIGPDGKIVKKQGGGKKTKNNNASGGGQNATKQQPQQPGKPNNGPDQSSQQQKGDKPRTKPKSNNRTNRQRDKKQKAQGTFGVQG
jgi:hypothetical protein